MYVALAGVKQEHKKERCDDQKCGRRKGVSTGKKLQAYWRYRNYDNKVMSGLDKAQKTGEIILRIAQRQFSLGLLATPTIILMVMGLVFCWVTPENAHLHGPGSRFFFKHMVCWTLIGISLSALAYILGWRRWLKAAPYIALCWIGLAIYAATCPLIKGHWGWIRMGYIKINVMEFVPMVVALGAAYLVRILKCKAIWTVGMALMAVVVVVGSKAIGHQNRFEREDLVPTQQRMSIDASQTARAFLQNQCVGAVRESNWFGRSGIDTKVIPENTTTSMPAVSAALFGK